MNYANELKEAIKAATKAGKAIARHFHPGVQTGYHQLKTNPVTQARFIGGKIAQEVLRKKYKTDGLLVEDDVDDTARLAQERVWLVGPLDGCKNFVEGRPDFAVSIALVVQGNPVVGVVYNPITKELFHAHKGCGAFCNNKPIKVCFDHLGRTRLFVSIGEYARGDWASYEQDFDLFPRGGTAYKMAGVATGLADGTFTLSPKNEWDICAGHLLVEEAGGRVCSIEGNPVTYNKPITASMGLVYCNCQRVQTELLEVIAKSEKMAPDSGLLLFNHASHQNQSVLFSAANTR